MARYFWGREGASDDVRWHCFRLSPDQPGPNHESEYEHISLCGHIWSGLAAVSFPGREEPMCKPCIDELHELTITCR